MLIFISHNVKLFPVSTTPKSVSRIYKILGQTKICLNYQITSGVTDAIPQSEQIVFCYNHIWKIYLNKILCSVQCCAGDILDLRMTELGVWGFKNNNFLPFIFWDSGQLCFLDISCYIKEVCKNQGNRKEENSDF